MIFDLQARLAGEQVAPTDASASDLVSGMADECLAWSAQNGNGARRSYLKGAATLDLQLPELALDRASDCLLAGWVRIEVGFTLQTPWYSKDDRPFHVLDNPVRKDRVFGVPFMSAASWKGLLRWACRMEHGLLDHLAAHDGEIRDWDDPDWIVHLFGNARADGEEFSRGALHCRPAWFDRVGFEVINPHDRARRAGTQPITYEVVPPGTGGVLRLLYAPPPDAAERGQARTHTIETLLDAIEKLLTVYGFSAKRTAGWGIAKVERCTVSRRDREPIQADMRTVKSRVSELFTPPEGAG